MTIVAIQLEGRKGNRKASLNDYVSMYVAAGKNPCGKNEELSRFSKVEKHSTDNRCNTKNRLLSLCSEENNKYTD